jgi:hypothetical protein
MAQKNPTTRRESPFGGLFESESKEPGKQSTPPRTATARAPALGEFKSGRWAGQRFPE